MGVTRLHASESPKRTHRYFLSDSGADECRDKPKTHVNARHEIARYFRMPAEPLFCRALQSRALVRLACFRASEAPCVDEIADAHGLREQHRIADRLRRSLADGTNHEGSMQIRIACESRVCAGVTRSKERALEVGLLLFRDQRHRQRELEHGTPGHACARPQSSTMRFNDRPAD
jgi:hypothetical protein